MLARLGWQPYFSRQTDVDEMAQTPPVRIIEVHRNSLHVKGDEVDTTIPSIADVAVGDWLLLDRELPTASRLLDRKSLVKRRAPGHDRQVQLIAANIDTAFIVSSCNQDFNIARLERYIALAFEAEIDPVILLTKPDLCEDVATYADEAKTISELVPVLALNAKSDEARTVLAGWCKPGRTVAFLGSSGVGKSTLSNALAGNDRIETQAVREADAKGRHTTTRRQLHLLENGCSVLDTPGMRELQLTDAASGVGDVFADLQELSGQCRFNDCMHATEPGCAVRTALEAGEIDEARLARWQKLVAEEAFNSARLSERRTKDKALGKTIRGIQKKNRKRD